MLHFLDRFLAQAFAFSSSYRSLPFAHFRRNRFPSIATFFVFLTCVHRMGTFVGSTYVESTRDDRMDTQFYMGHSPFDLLQFLRQFDPLNRFRKFGFSTDRTNRNQCIRPPNCDSPRHSDWFKNLFLPFYSFPHRIFFPSLYGWTIFQ